MSIDELYIRVIDNKEVYFRKDDYPIKEIKQSLELERILYLLTGEEFETCVNSKYKKQLKNPENFKYIRCLKECENINYTCLCGENTCNHLIITKYIPKSIYFCVGSVCIERFNEDNSKHLYHLKNRCKCFGCSVPLVYRNCDKYEKNTKKNLNELCFDCWEQNKKIYLNVPYNDKDVAKSYGAKWNPEKKSWYVFSQNENRNYLIKTFGEKK
jgi:hypothetical protein